MCKQDKKNKQEDVLESINAIVEETGKKLSEAKCKHEMLRVLLDQNARIRTELYNFNEQGRFVVDDLEIIVRGIKEKPYYEIMYHEIGKPHEDYDIGFGSYNLDYVFEWKEKYFKVIRKENT